MTLPVRSTTAACTRCRDSIVSPRVTVISSSSVLIATRKLIGRRGRHCWDTPGSHVDPDQDKDASGKSDGGGKLANARKHCGEQRRPDGFAQQREIHDIG